MWIFWIPPFTVKNSTFFCEHFPPRVRSVTRADGGQYECQVSTQQKMSRLVNLHVIGQCKCANVQMCKCAGHYKKPFVAVPHQTLSFLTLWRKLCKHELELLMLSEICLFLKPNGILFEKILCLPCRFLPIFGIWNSGKIFHSKFLHLKVSSIVPVTIIDGGPDIYAKSGSSVEIKCVSDASASSLIW